MTMGCADKRKAGEMSGGQSQMSSGEGMVRGQTSAGLPDVELVEYLRERTGQTTAMAPGPQGQMPGGGMHIGPQETQMGTMSAGQHGEMPGGEMRAGPQETHTVVTAPQGHGQASASAMDAELAAYLRERQTESS